MKKLNIGLMLLGLTSTTVLAGGVDYQEPTERGIFKVGVEALYAQASDSDFLYAVHSATANGNTNHRNYSVDFSDNWGYHIDVAYEMAAQDPDFYLGWTHLHLNHAEEKTGVAGSVLLGGPGNDAMTFDGVPIGLGEGQTTYEYADVDLLIGKKFVFHNRYHLHPFTGLRYGRIEATDKVSYFLNGTLRGTGKFENQFCGLGPRAGIDASLDLPAGFSLVARAAGSLLIGSHSFKYHATNTPAGAPTSFAFKNNDDTINVPETDCRLGINYALDFSAQSSIELELGWNAVHYFDVMDKSNNSIVNSAASMTDWGFHGPYLRVQANIT